MASIRGLKRRIHSVNSTQQITRAMNLVATSKLQHARNKHENLRPYVEETSRIMHDIAGRISDNNNIYFTTRPVNNSVIIVISADRGLCGGYNANVCKAAIALANEVTNEHLITVGIKARDFFRRRKKFIIRTYQGVSETPFFEDATDIGLLAADLFESGEADEVYLVYTEFTTIINHTPRVLKLLPLQSGLNSNANGYMDFEPNEEDFLSYMIPKYISTVIYGAMVESAACEQGARMASMNSATKNSAELMNKFTLQYNKARQDKITQELTEIVSGASVL